VKDFSFENPNAPEIYPAMSEKRPEITVNIDIMPIHLQQMTYEIVLALRINAMSGEKVAFLIELDYAAITTIDESVTDEEEQERLLLGETPRYVFPFARNILADITQNAAFPPLVINPIDFDQFYQRHKKGTLKASLAAQSTDVHQGDPQPGGDTEAAAPNVS
jgi:preprotein translocase subunit SecB